jgi:ABC-type phosphate transport system substrate-binding protein
MNFFSTVLALILACGSSPVRSCYSADILVGGSSDEQPLIKKWVEGYKSWCSDTNLVLEELPCSSSCGARRVCSVGQTADGETALDVGTLSRPWRELEATSNNGFLYQCAESEREIVSIDAALFALIFAVGTGGVAHECIEILGGLTLDQLRYDTRMLQTILL